MFKSGGPYQFKWELKSTEAEPNGFSLNVCFYNLLSNQLSWCNSHKDIILKQAEKLYRIIKSGKAWDNLAERCCDFQIDEQQCLKWIKGQL